MLKHGQAMAYGTYSSTYVARSLADLTDLMPFRGSGEGAVDRSGVGATGGLMFGQMSF